MIHIDPPVTPYSPPAELLAWIARLQELRRAYPQDAGLIDLHIATAEDWLRAAGRTEAGKPTQ
jgi:hypothetical protein